MISRDIRDARKKSRQATLNGNQNFNQLQNRRESVKNDDF